MKLMEAMPIELGVVHGNGSLPALNHEARGAARAGNQPLNLKPVVAPPVPPAVRLEQKHVVFVCVRSRL